jgi:hypothetical protein
VTYDIDGNVSSQISFSDRYIKGVSQSQNLTTSMYHEGELVEQSQVECRLQPTRTQRLPDRQTMFETLGLTEKDYSATTPLDAQELLTSGHGGHVDDADTFLGATLGSIDAGNFNLGQDIARAGDMPHSITWTKTLYQDGEKTVTQRDSETVRENPILDSTGFQTCTGLSEDKDPAYICSTSHSVETYENGQPRDHVTTTMREAAVDDVRDITQTDTIVSTSIGSQGQSRDTHAVLDNSLKYVDKNRDAAAQKGERIIQMTLDNFLALFKDPNEDSDTL